MKKVDQGKLESNQPEMSIDFDEESVQKVQEGIQRMNTQSGLTDSQKRKEKKE